MKAKEIQELIDFIAKSGLDEVNIETEEFKIKVKKSSESKKNGDSSKSSAASLSQEESITSPSKSLNSSNEVNAATPANASTNANDESRYKIVTSPMIGTFYRSANPGSPYFVNVGDKVTAGQTVCIVEAMKLFNEIESEISGTVVKILVENASPVEYDQPLFLIDPV
jgi:acetyl-CoA carboxylase biotin carboxyl carrier protein